MEEKRQGGKRSGAGRKPLPITQKKTVLTLYPTNADIYKFGNKEKMSEEVLKFIASYNKETPVVAIQDLNKQTHQVKPVEPLGTPKSNYQAVVTPTIPLNPFETAKARIKATTWSEELEPVMKEIERDPNIPNSKKELLRQYARERRKDFTN